MADFSYRDRYDKAITHYHVQGYHMSGATVLAPKLFCWCGRPLTNLYCAGCSSRPFACECFDGSTTKVSQQFSMLARLIQDSFRSLDLSRFWQKTPAELTSEERGILGLKSVSQSQSTASASVQTAESGSVRSVTNSAQVPRLFESPVVRMGSPSVAAFLGVPIDIGRVAKSFPSYPKFVDGIALNFGAPVMITNRGVIDCTADSEVQGRKAVEEAIRQLRQLNVKVPNQPIVQVTHRPVDIYLGRGIMIESLPDRVPDSLFGRRSGEKVEGKYNRAGLMIPLRSVDDIARGINELRQGLGFKPLQLGNVWKILAYVRIRSPPVIATIARDLDVDGNMEMLGYVSIENVKSEAEAQEAARSMDKLLEEAGLLGPLTPREKLQQGHVEDDPKGFDYFANDPDVWER